MQTFAGFYILGSLHTESNLPRPHDHLLVPRDDAKKGRSVDKKQNFRPSPGKCREASGFRRMHDDNQTLVAKLGWKVQQNSNREKYLKINK
jgi:hypothetical protein